LCYESTPIFQELCFQLGRGIIQLKRASQLQKLFTRSTAVFTNGRLLGFSLQDFFGRFGKEIRTRSLFTSTSDKPVMSKGGLTLMDSKPYARFNVLVVEAEKLPNRDDVKGSHTFQLISPYSRKHNVSTAATRRAI